jgi:low temperature requirement protein LtrA
MQSKPEKKVTWAELFFDLVFVFAVTQVSHLLHDDHSWAGVAGALIVLVPVYWAWVGTSIHANTHDVDNPLDRIGIFTVGAGSLAMALALPGAWGDRGWLFGAAYLGVRLVLAALVFRGVRGIPVNSFSTGLLITGPLLLVGGLLDGPVRVVLWTLAAAVDLLVPWLVRRRLAAVSFAAGHLPERFGLFVIVALGESVVAVGMIAAEEPVTAGRLLAVGGAYAVACGLWWVYFVFAAGAMHHALSSARAQTEIVRSVLAYGHLLFIAGIIAVAVGLAEAAAHPGEHLHLDAAAVLFGGAALYLGAFGYTKWRMFRQLATARLGAAAACLALLPLAPLLPAVVAVWLLAVVTIGVNAAEAALKRRESRTSGQPQQTQPA